MTNARLNAGRTSFFSAFRRSDDNFQDALRRAIGRDELQVGIHFEIQSFVFSCFDSFLLSIRYRIQSRGALRPPHAVFFSAAFQQVTTIQFTSQTGSGQICLFRLSEADEQDLRSPASASGIYPRARAAPCRHLLRSAARSPEVSGLGVCPYPCCQGSSTLGSCRNGKAWIIWAMPSDCPGVFAQGGLLQVAQVFPRGDNSPISD